MKKEFKIQVNGKKLVFSISDLVNEAFKPTIPSIIRSIYAGTLAIEYHMEESPA